MFGRQFLDIRFQFAHPRFQCVQPTICLASPTRQFCQYSLFDFFRIKAFQVNAFGFGGQNASLVVTRE